MSKPRHPFLCQVEGVILGGVLLGRWLHNETLLDIESNCIEKYEKKNLVEMI